jgi:glucokinase
MPIIGIDLGGTRIKGVAIDQAGNVLHQSIRPTNDGQDGVWKQAVAETVRDLMVKCGIPNTSIGISAPGLPNEAYNAIAYMPGRMQGLENFNWSNHLGQPTFVLNDAVSALVAEARFGAARSKKHVAMITLGTGVGGAILIDGKPYGGAFNKAGHIGHMAIDCNGSPDVTNMPGSLEECIGNCTIEKRSNGRFKSTHELLAAHHQGDAGATEIWLRSVRHLAIGLASITNVLSPERIVLGGGITEAGEALFAPLKEYMQLYEWRAGDNQVEIVKAQFGDIAGAIGAACFASDSSQNI